MERADSLRRLVVVWVVAAVAAVALLPVTQVFAAAGIWESYVVLNDNYYDVNANTNLPNFPGASLGVFTAGSSALVLNGGEVKTFKNNETDVQSARLYYRVFPAGIPSGAFTAINLLFIENLGNPGDQKWGTASANINLLTGLGAGNYTLEIYYEATTNGVNASTTIYDNNNGNNYVANFAVTSAPTPITAVSAKALWLDTNTVAWNGVTGSSYRLLYDPDGGMTTAAEAPACSFTPTFPVDPCYVNLTVSDTVSGFPKNPNATGLTRLTTGLTADAAKHLLKGQVVVASYNGGARVDATRVQIQSVLDHLYVDNGTADDAVLGVTYSGSVPTIRVWAPTAKSVKLRRYTDSTTTTFTEHELTPDTTSGVWRVTGTADWDRDFYLFDVEVYVPSLDQVVHNLVTDPYAITLSTDTTAATDPRSQFVNLADSDLKPTGWDSLSKPALASFEDIVIYETHIRDFSINDPTVTEAHRGTYLAFTYDGLDDADDRAKSKGMDHLQKLQAAGLTHIHLLPAFDIASVPENSVPRGVSPNPIGYGRASDQPQSIVGSGSATDGFNWGYDPYHYGAPEGSYATNPDGAQRVLEFREMVKALSDNGLRVVMDVVYNHTAASGQNDKSVLDKVVPGYYYRYTTDGALYTDSCCDDTASEYAMFEKLMIDTLKRWAIDYKVDSFRFDLMNFHTRQNMLDIKTALAAFNASIYLYGEGWDFGSAAAKGLTTCPNCYAKQANMTGTGIGSFNDKLRDAAHGGYSQDDLGIRKQGYINGLSYDWNGYYYAERFESDLYRVMDVLRSALRSSGTDWNNQGQPFTDDPQESVPYVEKHDNETLFDQNVFKLPGGTSMADRVRVQNLGTSLVALAQGVPFFQMGQDILRSATATTPAIGSTGWTGATATAATPTTSAWACRRPGTTSRAGTSWGHT
jgi:pullulanase/glycogen debranching enzyme